jgi:transcriptional regulator with XRE-family HTH domain
VPWQQWMRQIGLRVRRARESLGLSQDEVARSAGISQGAVSRLESGRGQRTPFLSVVRVLMVLVRKLRGLDPSLLTPETHGLVRAAELVGLPGNIGMPGGRPSEGGEEATAAQPEEGVAALLPEIERLIRTYRALPPTRRTAFVETAERLGSALRE